MFERINESAVKIHRVPGGNGPAGNAGGPTGRNTGIVSRPVVSGLVESDLAWVVSPGGRGGWGRVVSGCAASTGGAATSSAMSKVRPAPERRSGVTRAPRPFAAETP